MLNQRDGDTSRSNNRSGARACVIVRRSWVGVARRQSLRMIDADLEREKDIVVGSTVAIPTFPHLFLLTIHSEEAQDC